MEISFYSKTLVFWVAFFIVMAFLVQHFFVLRICGCGSPIPEAGFEYEEVKDSKLEITHRGGENVTASNLVIEVYNRSKTEYDPSLHDNKTWASRAGIPPDTNITQWDSVKIDKPEPGKWIVMFYIIPEHMREEEIDREYVVYDEHKIPDLSPGTKEGNKSTAVNGNKSNINSSNRSKSGGSNRSKNKSALIG